MVVALLSLPSCGSDGVDAGICTSTAPSVARLWNDQALDAIRRDEPAPTVHARNLFHLSAAMWDAFAAFDDDVDPVFVSVDLSAKDKTQARVDAISFAAVSILQHRYRNAVGRTETFEALDAAMLATCGTTVAEALSFVEEGSAAWAGTEIARLIIAETINDGSNERLGYEDLEYEPVNAPLAVNAPGTVMLDPNRWQPLSLEVAIAQNGTPLPGGEQEFIGSQWGHVTAFALEASAEGLPVDPGPPPQVGDDTEFVEGVLEVIEASSELGVGAAVIDLSPGVRGNNPLGSDSGTGHGDNPVTGAPYDANEVDRADYLRVIAEYWADGPDSETPPGHWNVIANEVSDVLEPDELRFAGTGDALSRLEWDLRLYLTLNGAMHDAAIAAWGAKAHYDYVRPISMIRWLAGNGQSSDERHPTYSPDGLPLVDGLVEIVTEDSSAPGERHAHLADSLGVIAIHAWLGAPDDPVSETSGVGWIRAIDWVPYQRPTFVTPSFAAYVSGHSAFSRAGAEILTAVTGSPYFPDGLSEHTTPAGALLHEEGPTTDVTLQWASYADAADEAGRSRIAGGIHVPVDDLAGREMGAEVADAVWDRVTTLFE